MSIDREKLAPFSFVLAAVALLFTAGWYVVNRQLGLPGQIGLGLTVLAGAGGVLLDPDQARRALSGRRARYGSNALLLTIAFAGILAIVNYLTVQNPQSWDLTEDQQYSLTPETKNLLESLEEPVRIIGFYTPEAGGSRENSEPLLNQYQAASEGMVEVDYIDPRQQPLEADRYGVTRDASLVVIQGDQSEVVNFATEREISSSIIRVTSPEERVVYFITGHGEREIDSSEDIGYSQVRAGLESKNYRVEELNLLSTSTIPEDADVLILAGATQPLSDQELSNVDGYLQSGGSLMILFEPTFVTELSTSDNPLLPFLEEEWGLLVRNDVVVDLGSNLPLAGIAASYANHPITERMGNLASYFPTARSMVPVGESEEGLTISELVQTGPNSWGETNIEELAGEDLPDYDDETDIAGPMTLSVAIRLADSEGRLVVFGDSDFASNANFFGLGNGDLFVNSVDWLAGEEDLIQLTPRERTQRTVVPPSVQVVGLIFLATVILIPGASIGIGVAVWWRRRRRMG